MSGQGTRAFLASGELLSISEASKLTPYSAEYLSLLARKGKFPAVKIARNWMTTSGSVARYVSRQRKRHHASIAKLKISGPIKQKH